MSATNIGEAAHFSVEAPGTYPTATLLPAGDLYPGGSGATECLAAIVTTNPAGPSLNADLAVFVDNGSIPRERSVAYDAGGTPGTWHWRQCCTC